MKAGGALQLVGLTRFMTLLAHQSYDARYVVMYASFVSKSGEDFYFFN